MTVGNANGNSAFFDGPVVANIGRMNALAPSTSVPIQRRLKLDTGHLASGMYVAELDRPWLDTPFLIEGFLIDDPLEIETLREHCRYVYIDPTLSDPTVVPRIKAAHETPGPSRQGSNPGAVFARHPGQAVRGQPDARAIARFRQFLQSIEPGDEAPPQGDGLIRRAGKRLRRWISSAPESSSAANPLIDTRERELRERLAQLGIEPTRYDADSSFDDAMPAATIALGRLASAAATVFASIAGNSTPDLEDAAAAVRLAAASVIRNPDAPFCALHSLTIEDPMIRQAVFTSLCLLGLGRSIGLPGRELEAIGLAGLLADAGKVRLPRALLGKPGMLSPPEYALAREHVRMGLEALRRGGALPAEADQLIAQHHERLDGSGYPRGLNGERIGLWGRLGAIADCYCALVTPRPYADALSPRDALASLYDWAAGSFDALLVERLVHAIGAFPAGSLVELSSGETAMVIVAQRPGGPAPTVRILLDHHQQRPDVTEIVKLGGAHRRIIGGLPLSARLLCNTPHP
jgi:hypothetical protein